MENELDSYNESLAQYQAYCKEKFFYVCQNKTVLELAPNDGVSHTNLLIDLCQPNKLTLVELNTDAIRILTENYEIDNINIIQKDIFKFYHDQNQYDVVTCCGLLYHLHSPFYLLELIVNQSLPNYIILDSLNWIFPGYNIENPNVCGERQALSNWKTCNFHSMTPLSQIQLAMTDLGYREVFLDNNIERFNYPAKRNFWMGLWEKIV